MSSADGRRLNTRMASDGPLRAFAGSFPGEVVLPGDDGYEAARFVWNRMVDRRPAAVVRPIATDGVIAALRFARDQDLQIAVRGGGHSLPGLSTCDDGMVIDLSRMHGAEVDAGRRIARVAAGSLLGELDDAAQAAGLVCPVGVVSHTGVAGLTLGGGMGKLQRRFGLTIDNLRAVEVVTADGEVVRASDDENPNLFWGLRGAGANFGIATAFEFALHPFEGTVTHGVVTHPVERLDDAVALFREAVESGPGESMPTLAVVRANGRPVVSISAFHSGSPEQAKRDLAELRAHGPPLLDTIEVKPYRVAQHLADGEMEWGHRFYMKSAFLRELPTDVVTRCAELVAQGPPGVECVLSVWAWGGAIASVPEDGTAFTGREASYWASAEAQWDDRDLDPACREWVRDMAAELMPYALTGRYVNDVAEAGTDLRSVYGEAKFDRLVGLKREWDPDNVFRLNQNIRP
jgi:FAD/FMN-containing dehydrogenase